MNHTFPVTHSVLSTHALMTGLLPDYGLGPVTDCTFINRGLNDTYLVKTQSGKYILRVYRTNWRSHPTFSTSWMRFCT